jgi:hypothetical protein
MIVHRAKTVPTPMFRVVLSIPVATAVPASHCAGAVPIGEEGEEYAYLVQNFQDLLHFTTNPKYSPWVTS